MDSLVRTAAVLQLDCVLPMTLEIPNAAAVLRTMLATDASLAVVLGSGFQAVLPSITVEKDVPFEMVPGFPKVGVSGHAGRLLLVRWAGIPVIVLAGRAHFYEGYSMQEITLPVRILAAAGVTSLLLTNAAGGINRKMRCGDFMFLKDHINFMGDNPLRGPLAAGAMRFVDLSKTYDARLNRMLVTAARRCRARMHGGVYAAMAGPSYETPAEIRALSRLGADAVGMSTVPEAIVAKQCGLRVAGLSSITNLAAGRGKGTLSHAEVLAAGERSKEKAARLLCEFVELYAAAR